MNPTISKIGNVLFKGYLTFVFVWIISALSFDLFMIGAHFFNPDLATKIGNEISWKIDGTFKNNPNNIWYEGDK